MSNILKAIEQLSHSIEQLEAGIVAVNKTIDEKKLQRTKLQVEYDKILQAELEQSEDPNDTRSNINPWGTTRCR